MGSSTEGMSRYAALLAAEFRLARPPGEPPQSPSELARELLPGYVLFRGRFGASEEATAVFRAEIAKALPGGDEATVAAALVEIGSGPVTGASEPSVVKSYRLWSEFVFGCALMGFGMFMGFPMAQATLSCQRPPSSPESCATASCRLQWHVLFGAVPIRDTRIDCLAGAEHVRVETEAESKTNVSYKVMLSAGDEAKRYAMNISGASEPTLAATTQVQSFLATPGQNALRVVLSPTGDEKWLARFRDCLLVLGLVTVLSVPVQIMRSRLAGD